jgi:hypothetical protein
MHTTRMDPKVVQLSAPQPSASCAGVHDAAGAHAASCPATALLYNFLWTGTGQAASLGISLRRESQNCNGSSCPCSPGKIFSLPASLITRRDNGQKAAESHKEKERSRRHIPRIHTQTRRHLFCCAARPGAAVSSTRLCLVPERRSMCRSRLVCASACRLLWSCVPSSCPPGADADAPNSRNASGARGGGSSHARVPRGPVGSGAARGGPREYLWWVPAAVRTQGSPLLLLDIRTTWSWRTRSRNYWYHQKWGLVEGRANPISCRACSVGWWLMAGAGLF